MVSAVDRSSSGGGGSAVSGGYRQNRSVLQLMFVDSKSHEISQNAINVGNSIMENVGKTHVITTRKFVMLSRTVLNWGISRINAPIKIRKKMLARQKDVPSP